MERVGAEPVSDGLKTFSAIIERSSNAGNTYGHSGSRRGFQTLLSLIRSVNNWKEVVMSKFCCSLSVRVFSRA